MAMFMSAKTDLCPLCEKPTLAAHKPFCSQGCKDRDLLQWLNEGYRIPARPELDDERDSGLDNVD